MLVGVSSLLLHNFKAFGGNIQVTVVFSQVKLSQLVDGIGGRYGELDLAPEND